MKNSILLLCAGIGLLVGCQKEPNVDISGGGNGGGGNGGGTTAELLVKAISVTGSDSVVVNYGYDGAKRLILEKIVGISQGADVGNEQHIIRDASGIITKLVQKNAAFQQVGLDSIISVVYYDAGTSRYTSRVQQINYLGFSFNDSSVFIYDAAGKVTQQDEYQSDPLGSGSYIQAFKTEYIYSTSGNLDKFKQYDLSSGSPNLLATYVYVHDGKLNPLRLNNETFVIGKPELISTNNVVSFQLIDQITPANSFTTTTTFTYNNNNKPSTGVSTQTPGNIVSNSVYYYQ